MPEETNSSRDWRKPVIKIGLTALVLIFVGRRTWTLIGDKDFGDISVCPGWLALSAVCYGLGWLPSIWFWRNLMSSLGQTPDWLLTCKAYYAGHLAKYVPGKAGVLLIRSAVLKEKGYQFGTSILTCVYETLMVMGVGLVVAGALAPLLVPESTLVNQWAWLREWRWLPGALLITAAVLAAPLITRILSWLSIKLMPTAERTERISTRQLLLSYGVFLLTWISLGLSLGATLQSLSDEWLSLRNLPLWMAAISASTVIGFFAVFTPGGLGVREGIMIEILRIQPEIPTEDAVLASWILRLVWLTTEAICFALFWWLVRKQQTRRTLKSVPTS